MALTEMLNLRAELLVNLSQVLRAGGDEAAAEPVIGDAIALYQRKGNAASAARVRSPHDRTS